MAKIIVPTPGCKNNNINTKITKFGIAVIISKTRCITVSTRPPNQPEIKPYNTPTVKSNIAAEKAINNDNLVPYKIRDNKSLPKPSVPK